MWSKRLRQAAALAASLLLLHVPSSVWAAAKKASAKPVPARAVSARVAKGGARRAKPAATAKHALEEFGPADLLDDNGPGLRGHASFYGHGFHGRKTSTGEVFDVGQFTAASNRFPLGSLVAVRRVDTGRCAVVKVNDRMHAKHRVRIIDVSRGVAEYLGMIRAGVVFVQAAQMPPGLKSGDAESCQAAFEPLAGHSHGEIEKMPKFGSGD